MKIAVLLLPGIGDSLMATPMIRVLKKNFPKAQLDVLCMFKTVQYVFKNNKNVDNVFYLPLYYENRLKATRDLFSYRAKKYDISILGFPAFRKEYHVVQWLLGAKKKIAHEFKKDYFKELNFLNTNLIKVDENVHNVINNLNLLNALSIDWTRDKNSKSLEYDLNLDREDLLLGKKYIEELGWKNNYLVGLHPGSIQSKAGVFKRWPVEKFIELAKVLISQNKKVLIFCGSFELDLGKQIIDGVNSENCRLVENTTFGESLGILKNLKLFISNDNGFAHLANALRVKSIVLFGPTNPLWCAPYNKKYCLSIRKAKFTPWFRNDIKVTNPPQGVTSGMDKITVGDVVKEMNRA